MVLRIFRGVTQAIKPRYHGDIGDPGMWSAVLLDMLTALSLGMSAGRQDGRSVIIIITAACHAGVIHSVLTHTVSHRVVNECRSGVDLKGQVRKMKLAIKAEEEN